MNNLNVHKSIETLINAIHRIPTCASEVWKNSIRVLAASLDLLPIPVRQVLICWHATRSPVASEAKNVISQLLYLATHKDAQQTNSSNWYMLAHIKSNPILLSPISPHIISCMFPSSCHSMTGLNGNLYNQQSPSWRFVSIMSHALCAPDLAISRVSNQSVGARVAAGLIDWTMPSHLFPFRDEPLMLALPLGS